MDFVFLQQLEVDTVIGIHEWERKACQPVFLDLQMAAEISRAAETDAISEALDYQAVAERISNFVRTSNFQLVETLAEACAQVIMQEFSVPWLRLTVTKPQAIKSARAVGVTIERGTK